LTQDDEENFVQDFTIMALKRFGTTFFFQHLYKSYEEKRLMKLMINKSSQSLTKLMIKYYYDSSLFVENKE